MDQHTGRKLSDFVQNLMEIYNFGVKPAYQTSSVYLSAFLSYRVQRRAEKQTQLQNCVFRLQGGIKRGDSSKSRGRMTIATLYFVHKKEEKNYHQRDKERDKKNYYVSSMLTKAQQLKVV
ncbi:hypothetical protein AVEN_208506-1 [Araneus ventricosus]|uniref:Uncharacterized protein n=1 Tax=Araneus ventricosus TaxID=182803 RepID=A0A4Y2E4S6_ARAVE|nr:hypothetical protein AVEN_208506-1 [Araneus ventricosus]